VNDVDPAWSASGSSEQVITSEPTPVTHTGKCFPVCDTSNNLSFYLGQWLLDSRLLNKRLDVRIHGTTKNLYRNGAYENACGFLVLTSVPRRADASLVVKIGMNQSKLHFKANNITPQLTTECAPIVAPEAARSIASTIGQRVVIVGRDSEGKMDTLGCYGQITDCPWPLAPGYACVAVNVPGSQWLVMRYFFETSLCRSIAEPVEWSGKTVY